jgi:serine/threonine protein kinase
MPRSTYYKNEVSAFRRLRSNCGTPNPNIISFHGSYIQGTSFNVILEYADRGSLEQYFQETKRPKSREDIICFWDGLFAVLKALVSIHDVESHADGPQILQGQVFQVPVN